MQSQPFITTKSEDKNSDIISIRCEVPKDYKIVENLFRASCGVHQYEKVGQQIEADQKNEVDQQNQTIFVTGTKKNIDELIEQIIKKITEKKQGRERDGFLKQIAFYFADPGLSVLIFEQLNQHLAYTEIQHCYDVLDGLQINYTRIIPLATPIDYLAKTSSSTEKSCTTLSKKYDEDLIKQAINNENNPFLRKDLSRDFFHFAEIDVTLMPKQLLEITNSKSKEGNINLSFKIPNSESKEDNLESKENNTLIYIKNDKDITFTCNNSQVSYSQAEIEALIFFAHFRETLSEEQELQKHSRYNPNDKKSDKNDDLYFQQGGTLNGIVERVILTKSTETIGISNWKSCPVGKISFAPYEVQKLINGIQVRARHTPIIGTNSCSQIQYDFILLGGDYTFQIHSSNNETHCEIDQQQKHEIIVHGSKEAMNNLINIIASNIIYNTRPKNRDVNNKIKRDEYLKQIAFYFNDPWLSVQIFEQLTIKGLPSSEIQHCYEILNQLQINYTKYRGNWTEAALQVYKNGEEDTPWWHWFLGFPENLNGTRNKVVAVFAFIALPLTISLKIIIKPLELIFKAAEIKCNRSKYETAEKLFRGISSFLRYTFSFNPVQAWKEGEDGKGFGNKYVNSFFSILGIVGAMVLSPLMVTILSVLGVTGASSAIPGASIPHAFSMGAKTMTTAAFSTISGATLVESATNTISSTDEALVESATNKISSTKKINARIEEEKMGEKNKHSTAEISEVEKELNIEKVNIRDEEKADMSGEESNNREKENAHNRGKDMATGPDNNSNLTLRL